MKRILFLLVLIGLTACAPAAPPVNTPAPTATVARAASTPEAGAPDVSPIKTEAPILAATEAVLAPTATSSLAPEAWMQMPVVPTAVSARARLIYQRGLEMGRDPRRFSKVGDCQNVESYFLAVFETPAEYSLGEENAYLSETIEYYQGSFSRDSLAVKGGFNVAAILSPLRADRKQCQKNVSPLDCELDTWNPSIAIVSLEEWWAERPVDEYADYLRLAVDDAIAKGVLPILATRAGNTPKALELNAAIAQVAYENEIPLWNFWLAIQPLPSRGLSPDGFHLTFARNFFDDPLRMQNAWPWRNLTALQAIHAVRIGLQSSAP